MILGRIEGIDRPVLASVYPCIGGTDASLLLDAGASSEAKAHTLVEYGLMGSIYMEKVLGRENPRVGLVNLGVEEGKGTGVTKEAYQRLKNAPVNFVGNVEAREIPDGVCDIIVCDGFVGNVILKLTEGLAWDILKLIKGKMMETTKSKIAGLLMKKQMSSLKSEFNYAEYGGAPVLGVNRPVLKIHGSSNAEAVKNAIIKAVPYAKEDVVNIIRQSMLDLEESIEKEEE